MLEQCEPSRLGIIQIQKILLQHVLKFRETLEQVSNLPVYAHQAFLSQDRGVSLPVPPITQCWHPRNADFVARWIEMKQKEFSALRLRPHPYEFAMYYDV